VNVRSPFRIARSLISDTEEGDTDYGSEWDLGVFKTFETDDGIFRLARNTRTTMPTILPRTSASFGSPSDSN
jgi:hypothetical protein